MLQPPPLLKEEHEKHCQPPRSNLQQTQYRWPEGPTSTSGGLCLQPETMPPRRAAWQNEQICHWLPGLLTDDSRFTLSTCDRHERVWRRCGERCAVCYIFPCDRLGDGWWGLGRGILRRLRRPPRANLGYDHRTRCWQSGLWVPSVARCGWRTSAAAGWWRNC